MIAVRTWRIHKETIQLLRFPFSLFLAPVYFFALSQTPVLFLDAAVLCFIILHLLVYPSSNGFNSYMDRDTTSIGGLEKPPLPSSELYIITVLMDFLAVGLSFLIHVYVAFFVALYIIASRAYSDRRIRLKKYPWIGFFVVSIFQGGVVYFIVYIAANLYPIDQVLTTPVLLGMFASSLIIGASYPMTQIYQHEADRQNGDTTLSFKLGYTGTFLFSGALFFASMLVLYLYFQLVDRIELFYLFLLFTSPMLIFFVRWFVLVKKDQKNANFKNTMRMNTISAVCTAAYFLIVTFLNFF